MPVPTPSPPVRRPWATAIVGGIIASGVLLFLIWTTRQRIERINYVSATASWSVDPPDEDASSPTGYSALQRRLIIPGHHNPSYRWIEQTQQTLAGGSLRDHHVTGENFPIGYQSNGTLPYRAWLALVAWIDQASSRRSTGLSVEHSVLYADPLLQGLLVMSVGIFVGVQFGGGVAAAAMLALVTLFPLGGGFQAGAPDHHSLAWALALWSVLFLGTGVLRGNHATWSALAGVAGGLAIWTDRTVGEPLLLGLLLGGVTSNLIGRDRTSEKNAPSLRWRIWGLSGAVTCLIAYLLEYFPANPGWTVESIHPLHTAAWLGAGELLHQVTLQVQVGARRPAGRTLFLWAIALVGIGGLPVAIVLSENGRFLADDPYASELVNLLTGTRAPNFWAWITRDGLTPASVAVGVPVLLVGLIPGVLLTKKILPVQRSTLFLVLGPLLVSVALASQQLRWWNGVDAMLVAAIVATGAIAEQSSHTRRRWLWRTACVLIAIPGALLLLPQKGPRGSEPLDEIELQSVVERDLAYWLNQQNRKTPVAALTTPGLSEALNFYGNVQGIVSYAPENRGGISGAVRMASASTWTEVSALFESRGITHVIFPSWDPSLNRLAQLGRQLPPDAEVPRNTLVARLQGWDLPPWLGSLSYHTPEDLGSRRLAATVFAVRSDQDEILAACRMADYFVEMGLVDEVRKAREKLTLYPRSLPALTTLAQINLILGDTTGFKTTLDTLLPYVSRRAARTLPLDRRIGLAALLVQAKQMDEARSQVTQCNQEINADRLRELTTSEIVRLLAMNDVLGLTLPDPQLRPLGLSLLPPSLRARLRK